MEGVSDGKATFSQMKQTARNNMKTIHAFPKNVSAVGVVAIKDVDRREFVLQGMSAIGMAAIVLGGADSAGESIENVIRVNSINPNDLVGFDFFLFDGECDGVDVVQYMRAGIVPIMPEKNVFSGMLKDFNPMKFEGNGFFYRSDNPYCMFEKIVCYTENVKFPEDRRVLLKNVISTF